MGFVQNLVGTVTGNAGGAGSNYRAGSADLQTPITNQSGLLSVTSAREAIAKQQALLQALQAQNGIQNQSNVFNQLQGVANGQGPNPAQAQLNQATGANTANQAALMASQRGAGANVGLIGRQAAQIGAQNQQQSAGQAATLQAQQSLGALNQLGNLASTQVGQQQAATNANQTGALAQEQNLLNAIAQQNNAKVGNQASINSANAGVAGATANQQGNLLGGLMGGLGGALPTIFHGGAGSMLGGAGAGGAVMAGGGDALGGAGLDAATAFVNKGGMIKQYEEGGVVTPQSDPLLLINNMINDPIASKESGPQSFAGKFMQGFKDSSPQTTQNSMSLGTSKLIEGLTKLAKGGKVSAMVSPGEVYLPPEKVEEVKKGKDPIKEGQKIPGKAKLKGDNYANDTVPRTLDEGGIVIPKSVMESKHPHWEAFKFVQKTLAKK